DLEQSINHYLATYNQNPRPFRWSRSAGEILASVGRAARAFRRN
ncbi:IS630 family transposase, partial [Pseudomonas luteola]